MTLNKTRKAQRTRSLFLICLFVMSALILAAKWPFGSVDTRSNKAEEKVTAPKEVKREDKARADQEKIKQTPQEVATPAIDTPAVKNAVQNVVSLHPELRFGVSYISLDDNNKFSVGGDQLFLAASTAKVLVAAYFLDQVQEGAYKMDMKLGNSTARYHLEQMIRQSNNDSWALFNTLFGFPAEKAYAKKLGLTYVIGNNSITSDDMATLLAKLYRRELLNEENTQLLLSLMQNTHDERYIPGSAIKATIYHKTGKWEGAVHDAAIVDDGTHKYVLVIYTNGKGSWDGRIPAFHEITEAVNRAIFGKK